MSGFVYFISYPATGWIKIGYTKSVKTRLRELQCASPECLELLATIPSPPSGERRLHRALRGHRRGEWFQRDGQVKAVVGKALAGASINEICEEAEAYAEKLLAFFRQSRIDRLQALVLDPNTDEGFRPIYERLLSQVTPIERDRLREKARRVAVAAASVA